MNAVWALDFMRDTLYSGRVFRTLKAIDEANCGALGIEIAVSISAARVIAFLTQMSDLHGLPAAIRCDKRPGANQPDVHRLVQGAGHRAALHPGRKARPERLHRAFQPDLPRGGAEYDLFDSLDEVRDITADWLDRYNEIRPHDALGSLPPARYRERLLTTANSSFCLLYTSDAADERSSVD